MTGSQPVIEKPASRWSGCAALETTLPIAPINKAKKLYREQRPGDHSWNRRAFAATNGSPTRTVRRSRAAS